MTWSTTMPTPQSVLLASVMAFTTSVGETPTFDFDELLGKNSLKVNNFENDYWISANTESGKNSERETADIVGVADIIMQVKTGLGLPNKDIANIFRVTRQTLHNYTKQLGSDHAVNAHTRDRAIKLNDITKHLNEIFEKSPGAMAKNFTIADHSLLDLMSKNHLNSKEIVAFSKKLAERMSEFSSGSDSLQSDKTLMELTRHT